MATCPCASAFNTYCLQVLLRAAFAPISPTTNECLHVIAQKCLLSLLTLRLIHLQIFEAYGLGKDVVELAFRGSVSRIGGMSLSDLQRETESFWVKGFPDKAMSKLEDYGFIQSKAKGEQMDSLDHWRVCG